MKLKTPGRYTVSKGHLPKPSNHDAFLLALFSIFLQVVWPAHFCQAQTAPLLQSSTGKVKLHDKFYFTSDSQSISTVGGGSVNADAGSLLERLGPDTFSLLTGTFTVSTGSSPLLIKVGDGAMDLHLPANSTLSMRLLQQDCAITVNNASAPVSLTAVSDAGRFTSSIASGATVPAGASLVPAIKRGGNINAGLTAKAPILIIGSALPVNQSRENGTDSIALTNGQLFIQAPRSLHIATPLGALKGGPDSRFFLTLNENSLRILNCSSKELKLEANGKYRRITPFEEFALYNHRPAQEEVLPPDGLGRKEVSMHDVDGTNTASTCSFLIPTMLVSPYFLGAWPRESALDKRLVSTMLKSAAVFDSVHPSSEQFYVAPDLLNKNLQPNLR